MLPDPPNPSSSTSLNPSDKGEDNVSSEFVDIRDISFKKNHNKNIFLERIVLVHKISLKDKEIKNELGKQNAYTRSFGTQKNLLSKLDQKYERPSFFSKLKVLFLKLRLPTSQGSKMSDKRPGRAMLYPYTFTAKIAQFPWKFYTKNNWLMRYYLIACVVSFPLFYKISRMSNSPENVKKWEEIRRRDFTPGGHH